LNSFTRLTFTVIVAFCARSAAAQPASPRAQKRFATAEDATKAFVSAVGSDDKARLDDLFGPDVRDLLTGNAKQDRANAQRFAKAVKEGVKLISKGGNSVTLEIGARGWEFPIPIVKEDAGWRFDTAAGKEAIIDRHIGKDELNVIAFCRAYAAALKSRAEAGSKTVGPLPKSFHGYFFRVVSAQGALLVYPDKWGRSGIMTFLVVPDGRIYQRDFGADTVAQALAVADDNVDGDWTPVSEPGIPETL
jgi:hypothetical protein